MLQAIENKLIYFPCGPEEGDWRPAELCVEDVYFETSDGLRLHAWYCSCPADAPSWLAGSCRPVLLYFHGNAGNLSHRAENIGAWLEALKEEGLVWAGRLENNNGQAIFAAALTRSGRELVA